MRSLAFFTPGPWEVLAVLFIILLLFGARKLPELSRSLGKSLGEFKKGREEGESPEPAKIAPDEAADADEADPDRRVPGD